MSSSEQEYTLPSDSFQEYFIPREDNSIDTLSEYLNNIGQYPLLTYNQKAILWQCQTVDEIKKHPDFLAEISEEKYMQFETLFQDSKTIKEMAVLTHLRLVVSIAKKYTWIDIPLLDKIQAGNTGLIKAVDKYTPYKKTQFSTMAVPCIQSAITHEHVGKAQLVSIPYNTAYALWHAQEYFPDPTTYPPPEKLQEILIQKGIPEEQIPQVIQLLTGPNVINSIWFGEQIPTIEGYDISYEEVLQSQEIPTDDEALSNIDFESLLKPLTPSQQAIIIDKFVFGLPTTEIGERRGKTRSVINSELKKIFTILRESPLVRELAESSQKLNQTIKTVPKIDYREKNIMYLIKQGITPQEIADNIGIPPTAVREIIRKYLKKS